MEEINAPSSPLSSLSSLSSIGSSPSPSPELRPIQPPTKLESPVSNLKSPMKQSQRLKRPAKPSISVSELLVDYSHWDFRIGNLTIDQADKILQEEENEKEEDLEDYISRQDFVKQSTELDKQIQNLITKKLPKSIKKPIVSDAEAISNNIANKKNHTTCSVCDSEGDMVCCDGCPRSFHFSCFVPPLDSNNLPEGHWYCYACEPRKIERKSSGVLLNKLLDGVSKLNPSCFEVPQTLVSEFQGLIQSREGDFVDNRRARTDKKRSNEPRNSWDNIILKSMDNNPPKVCFWCKKSRLVDPIIQCDYCPLNWHLCCLNPPLSEPPRLDKKFMCPHHVEHNLGPIWKREYNPYSLTIEEDEKESKKVRLTDTNIDSWINNTQLKKDSIKFTQDESELIARVFCDKANEKSKSIKEKNHAKLPNSNGKSLKHVTDDEFVIKKVKEKRKSEPSGPPSAFESKLKHLFKHKAETQSEPSQPELSSEEIDKKAILKEYLDFPKLPKIHSKLMNKEPKELIHMLKSIKK